MLESKRAAIILEASICPRSKKATQIVHSCSIPPRNISFCGLTWTKTQVIVPLVSVIIHRRNRTYLATSNKTSSKDMCQCRPHIIKGFTVRYWYIGDVVRHWLFYIFDLFSRVSIYMYKRYFHLRAQEHPKLPTSQIALFVSWSLEFVGQVL